MREIKKNKKKSDTNKSKIVKNNKSINDDKIAEKANNKTVNSVKTIKNSKNVVESKAVRSSKNKRNIKNIKTTKKKKVSKKKITKFIFSILMLVLSLICFKYVQNMNILPNKYLYLFLGIIIVVNVLSSIFLYVKGIITTIFSILLYIILAVVSVMGIKYAGNTIDFLNKGFDNNVEYSIYNVIVLNDSSYMNVNDLNETSMGYLVLDIGDDRYLEEVNNRVDVRLKELDAYELYEGLLDNSLSSMVINEAYLDLFEQEFAEFNEKTRVIDTIEVEKETNKKDNEEVVKELKPINIYLSGSDSRSGVIASSTLSDVNMIFTINPDTHTILMTNIPRDYYVQLHGTTGLKDKLTHAGIFGIDMSKQTIEDFMNIEIDYTVKVGFSSVIKLVDLVGGVDVYSEIAFRTYSSDGGAQKVNVKVGMNHFNGRQALSYARERFAYSTGDIHRGQNQQQIIEAIISKIMSDKSLLLKYDSLLNSFSELYKTDIPKEFITLFIKQQLEDMSSWNIEKQTLVGYDASERTYSWPGQYLYVMIPDENSIDDAIVKIDEVYNAKD